ncbi:MAG: DUF1844 domain-containing protein [Bradymonadaceae bacterium]
MSDDQSKTGSDADADPDLEDLGTPLGGASGVYVSDAEGDEDGETEAPIDFGSFIVSLGTSCMVNLGHVEGPESAPAQVNLPAAKQTIEILKLLRHKTEGNLDPEEEKLLESLIHDTTLAYREAKEEQQDA